MKIAFVSGLYPPAITGGAEIVLQTLAEGIRNRGHEVLVLTTKEKGDIERDLVNDVPVIRVPIKNIYWHGTKDTREPWKKAIWHAMDSVNLRMLSIAKDILKDERPDAVNVHAIEGWSAVVLTISKSLGIPTVQVLHSANFMCPNSNMFRNGHSCATQCMSCKVFRVAHKSMSNNADAVVGVSQFVLDRHLAAGYFARAKHRVAIHNARDLRLIDIEPFQRQAKANRKFVFGYIGHLSPAKGIAFLIDEFLSMNDPGSELWIAGTGQARYETELKRRYSSPQIRFLGYQKQADFFPQIDVLVVPSLCEEALGMVVPEAFAFGLPVIAARRGGIPEMIEDGKNGRIFEPNNQGELGTIMARFRRGQEDLECMGRAAKASAPAFLNIESWVDKYIRLNTDVVAARGG
ncbi:glycosyl transferase, group 1 [Caballeronia catudaia]|uniref:Glycosyl transferase, group 1 n=1 Tax=Caballeronia catudaia TaxID=1777136 RepID=A0A157ZSA6_9BURK|nr:glycosyltransferase family 4 protein [Caballeronia catudaia]SAK48359.1 glycosyl transferase, group 1 [Caballeronia catudaia]